MYLCVFTRAVCRGHMRDSMFDNFATHVSISELGCGGYILLSLRPNGLHGIKAITPRMEERYRAIYEGEYRAKYMHNTC